LKRKRINDLLEWKEKYADRPLILMGAKGVGKTYLANDFAKAFYSRSIYVNFESNLDLQDLFESDRIQTCMERLLLLSATHPNAGRKEENEKEPILLILDEISYCPSFMEKINEWMKVDPPFHILAITSQRYEEYENTAIFYPLYLYPLNFEEFLTAIGKEWYVESIRTHFISNKKLPDIVHRELLDLFEDYLQIGGMPSAINEFINTEGKYNIWEQHRILSDAYLWYAKKHTDEGEGLKISQVYNIMDKQLIKENRKFQYSFIRKGATQAMYAEAVQYITDTFYGMRCNKLEDQALEITSEREITTHLLPQYKLYMQDVGMLNSSLMQILDKHPDQIRKGIIENYVAQTLYSNGYQLYYWESSSQAKIDFLLYKDERILPIEVKTGMITRSKNLSVLKSKCPHIEESIKISTRNFEYSNHIKYVPIYAVFCI